MREFHRVLIAALVGCCACAPPDDVKDAGPDDAGVPDAGPEPDPCPDDACSTACAAPITGLCLPFVAIDADEAFQVTLLTSVCLSSTCTELVEPVCDVTVQGDTITVEGFSCFIGSDDGSGCSEDCGGGDGAPCAIPPLPAGAYTFHVGAQTLPLTIPASADDTQLCMGPAF